MTHLHTLATFALTLGLVACGGGYEGSPSPTDNSGQALALGGASSLTLVPTELGRVEVIGGSRPYTATSSNTAIALASISDGTLSVAAVRGDTTPVTVTVTDAKSTKTTLTVNVTNSHLLGSFALTPRELAVTPGGTRDLTITGGTGPFTVVPVKPAVATATVSGNTVTVTGVSEGVNAEVRVIDARGATQSAMISVATATASPGVALFSNLPSVLTLRPNTSQTFTLGGGTGPYTAASSNPAAVSTTVRGSALILDAGVGGSATLTITDNTGVTLTPAPVVRVLNTSAPLALTSSSVSGMVGTTTTLGIAGGLPPYRTSSQSTTQVGAATVNGNLLQISFNFVGGPMRVTVLDAEGSAVNVDITATAVLSAMTVSPSRIVISELLMRDTSGVLRQTSVPLLFVNAKPPVQVFTSHPRLLTPTANGNVVTVTTPGTSDAPVAPCVDLNTEVFITGIDASGASASTSITIADNGLCPN